ncbi:nuclear transport factor 2 family protein [Congregibacter variabilis]|uniref:Nuclear transport factor 2 family protein n=1 Tax=Congregibacter variabilis TaxID=3081200 RepID=A0ABZ0HZ78_9GAMM|nr:nuclear transport factor 2 family protein [Congregibacter sp. IMCC43200]
MNTLQRWHDMVLKQNHDGLSELLTEDCVFLSPVVHTPQAGRELTTLYLTGAMNVFNETFHYTKEVVTEEHAVLEFECTVDGILINGVDIISFAEDGRICEFRVMVRPLQAMQMLHGKMAAMLEVLKSAPKARASQSA